MRAAHWNPHLDYDWRSPVWRHWLEGLSRHRTLVRYDERGCGLSDRDPYEISFELFVQDLETVVDVLELERFLVGVSQGGPVAVEYARRHPEPCEPSDPDRGVREGPTDPRHDAGAGGNHELQRNLIRAGWGLDDLAPAVLHLDVHAGRPRALGRFRRAPAPDDVGGEALRIVDACVTIDVGEAATQITAPTLILHAHDELRIPFGEALEFASLIPGSRLVQLDSRNHLLRPDEPAWQQLLAELDRFLGDG